MKQERVQKYLLLIKKFTAMTLMILGVGLFFYFRYLDDYYFQNAPREPDVANGRVVAVNVHKGAIVFLTAKENDFRLFAFYWSIPLAMIGGLLNGYWKLWGYGREDNKISNSNCTDHNSVNSSQ